MLLTQSDFVRKATSFLKPPLKTHALLN